jgi:hypothetical protein
MLQSLAKNSSRILKRDLLGLENRLFIKEREFYTRVRDPTREALEHVSSGFPPSTDDFTTLETPSASTASTISVAHKYYSKDGDINSTRELIFNRTESS